jgi:hypothetical protein
LETDEWTARITGANPSDVFDPADVTVEVIETVHERFGHVASGHMKGYTIRGESPFRPGATGTA